MNRTKRPALAALLLAGAMALAACGGGATSSEGSAAEPAAQGSQSQESRQESPAAEGGKALTVVVAKPSVVEDLNTNDTSLWLEEKTGVHVTYDQIPSENVAEKVALLLAGGDLPDIFLNCSISSAQVNQYGIQDGVLIPLDDLIGQHAPNLQEAISHFSGGLDTIREVDGKIYSLPSINPCFHCTHALKTWINDEWLTKLGLAYPTTTDEFYNVLKAFKEQDPNGNGQADEIPLAGSINGWHTQPEYFLLGSFLPFDAGQKGFGLDEGGKVVNLISDERFREALRYLNKLYSEGLLYEGTLTQKMDQLQKLVENPDASLVGAVSGGYGGQFTSNIGGDRYRLYRPIEPLAGPEGVKYAGTFLQNPGTGAFVVTSDCADPVLAVQWGDTFYTTEATATVYNGLEGEGWRYAEDGELGFDGKPAIWAALKSYQGGEAGATRNDSWTQMGIYNFSDKWRMGQAVEPDLDPWSADGMEYMLFNTTLNMYAPYTMEQYVLPTLKLTDEEYTKIATTRTEWDNHFLEVIFNFVSGAWNLEGDWDSHVQSLDSTYRMNEMLEIYQAAYTRGYGK